MYIFFISRVMAEGKFDYIALDWLADEYAKAVEALAASVEVAG